MSGISTPKKSLLQWCVWFYLGNCALFCLIGLIYFPSTVSKGFDPFIDALVILGYIGHFTLIAFLPCIVIVPLILLTRFKRLIFGFSIIITTILSSLLLIDTIVYHIYQFHLNGTVLKLAVHGFT